MTLISMLMIIMIIMINVTLMILNLKSKRSFIVVKLNHVHLDYYHHYESNNHDDHYELDYDNHNESDDHES